MLPSVTVVNKENNEDKNFLEQIWTNIVKQENLPNNRLWLAHISVERR